MKGASWSDFAGKYGDWGRDLAIYVGRQRSGLTLREIGGYAGMKDRAVSQGAFRVRKRMEDDKLLKEQYLQILEILGEEDELEF